MIMSVCILALLPAIVLLFIVIVSPMKARSSQQSLKNNEYLQSMSYIKDMSKVQSIKDMHMQGKLRHEISSEEYNR